MTEKLSDAVARFVSAQGVRHVFTVSGGGIMHLLDSFGREPGLHYVCNYHEQACAIAAEAYARRSGGLGVCLVTTGPGSTNALSAIAGAWVDSVPVLVISGQVRTDLIADYRYVRQMGPQEINIDDMARPVTKFLRTVMRPEDIRATLEEAVFAARSGRPGPAWVNVPLDVQGAMIDWDALAPFVLPAQQAARSLSAADREQVRAIAAHLRSAERPVIVGGNGVHLGGAHPAFERFAAQTGVPVVVPIGATDLLHEEHPAFYGRLGPLGQRRGNFVVQNADLVLGLGASMSISAIGFNTDGFAPGADVLMVNVDPHEIEKARPRPVLGLAQDVGLVLEELATALDGWRCPAPWLAACDGWWGRYPPLEVHPGADDPINSYHFFARLAEHMGEGDTLLTGNSLDAWSAFQTFANKPGQRLFTNINFGAMGWDLPAIVGARQAAADGRVVLVTGDGSILFNIQELMTIGHGAMDIKIFVLNNQGYESIRTTQRNYFQGHFVGADPSSGVSNPDFEALARAFRLAYRKVETTGGIDDGVRDAMRIPGPVLVELMLDPAQSRSPRVMSRRREDGTMESGVLHNMFPFLSDEETRDNARFVPVQPKVRP